MSIVEIKIPSPGESITEVEIGSWLKADGDYVLLDETICEIETDKATLPLIAESAGALKIILQEGETAGIGDVACSIDTEAAQPETSSAEISSVTSETADSPEQSVSTTDSYAAGHPSPAARKMMAEQGIANVSGGGPGGRITKEDVNGSTGDKFRQRLLPRNQHSRRRHLKFPVPEIKKGNVCHVYVENSRNVW